MLFTCRRCGQSYSDAEEHRDGLCLYCRDRARMDGQDESMDWREPLYQCVRALSQHFRLSDCARLVRMLTVLGDYKDCAERLVRLHGRIAREYEIAVYAVSSSDSCSRVKNAVENLRLLGGVMDTREVLAEGEAKLRLMTEREETERKERLRRQYRRDKMLMLCRMAAAAAVVVWLLAYVLVVFPGRLDKAQALMEAGRYDEAVALYVKSEDIWKTERGAAGLRAAQEGAAGALAEAGRYEEAVAAYHKLKMEDEVNETRRLWSEALAAQGDAAGAVRILSQTPKSDARDERLYELRMQQADEAAAAVLARDEGGGQDAAFAAELGGAIAGIDAQLRFCRLLADMGYDLRSVYPDGVTVTDAPLARFRPEQAQEESIAPDLTRVLLFERTEKPYHEPWTLLHGFDSGAHDVTDDDIYSVKLLAGELFSNPALCPAASYADATAVILVDSVYVKLGTVGTNVRLEGVRTPQIVLPSTMIYARYPYFAAVNSVTAYDCANPTVVRSGYVHADAPACADQAWCAAHSGDEEALSSIKNRVGDFDVQALRAAVGESIDEIMREDGGIGDAKSDL